MRINKACSVVAVRPACRASLAMRSRILSCLRMWRSLVHHAACLPKGSRMRGHFPPPPPPRKVLPHRCPVRGARYPSLWHKPSLKTGSSRVVSHLPGKQWSHSPWPGCVGESPGRLRSHWCLSVSSGSALRFQRSLTALGVN